MDPISIGPLEPPHVDELPAAFAAVGWPGKGRERFVSLLDDQRSGTRAVFVARVGDNVAGYVTVLWESGYPPFREAGIPEVNDLNVLPRFRRRGVGSALLDAAEGLIATRSALVGIGVGLYADYGAAQAMYARRGYVPDGRGVSYGGMTVPPGAKVRVNDDLVLWLTRPAP